jgi:hypothetical protein
VIFNLRCHIYPLVPKWRRTVEHLKRYWPLFNGRKILAVALDEHCCVSMAEVKAAFAFAPEIEWYEYRNDPALREVISFVETLEPLVSLNPEEATFCCHAKGSTREGDGCASHPWCDVMFDACCGSRELIECALKRSPICGAFKLYGRDDIDWIFAGSFYWIRHDATFSRDWRRVPQIWTGTENWPCEHFRRNESLCLFMDNSQTPYDHGYWEREIIPSWLYWRENLQRAGLSMTEPLMCGWLRQRVETFRRQNGTAGFDTIAQAKKNWRQIPGFLRRAFSCSTK